MNLRRSGYSLVEMLVVVALFVVISAVAYPSIDTFYRSARVQAGGDALRSACTLARVHAMDEGQTYRVCILPGRGNYRVAPENPSYWSGNDSTPQVTDPAHPPLMQEEALPSGMRIVVGNDDPGHHSSGNASVPVGSVTSEEWTTLAVFTPEGTADVDVEFQVILDGTRPMTLQLRALTGLISIVQPGTENQP